MRIRKKKWAEPELSKCPYFVRSSEELATHWDEVFGSKNDVYLELGCGKGTFSAISAINNPDITYIACDIKSDMLGVARRNVEGEFEKAGKIPCNIFLMQMNIENISRFYGEGDSVDRIYINFCNPWPRLKHNKRRLTHTRQLEQYKGLLKKGGEIHFKTDDDELFEASLEYFPEANFKIIYKTYDLHESDYENNVMTEHEKMFSSEGKKIKLLIAVNE